MCTTVERKRTWKNFPESHVLLKTQWETQSEERGTVWWWYPYLLQSIMFACDFVLASKFVLQRKNLHNMLSIKGKWLSLHQDFITFRKVGGCCCYYFAYSVLLNLEVFPTKVWRVPAFCERSDNTMRTRNGSAATYFSGCWLLKTFLMFCIFHKKLSCRGLVLVINSA